jgi:RNA polymerase sigma-70 factor (ECF subfamily)
VDPDDRVDVDTVQPPDSELPVRLAEFDQYRSLLFSVAYRMLGSVADAEDMLQETFIRW